MSGLSGDIFIERLEQLCVEFPEYEELLALLIEQIEAGTINEMTSIIQGMVDKYDDEDDW